MTDKLTTTQDMLAKHHRDGEAFAEMMKQSFARRFNEDFWAQWQQYVEPALSSTPSIIDLGTGPGTFVKVMAEHLPKATVTGIECAPYMLEAAETLPANASIISADLHDPHLPFADGSVDAAVASVVIHEMHQPLKTFFEVARVLKPGGIFYILDWVRVPLEQYLQSSTEVPVFDPATDMQQVEDVFIHFIEHNRFSADDLIFMLKQCGFSIQFKQMINANQMTRLVAQKL